MWPNDWAEAHWLLNYRFGSLKRALIGTLLAPLFDNLSITYTEWAIGLFAGIFFGLATALLLWLCLRTVANANGSHQAIWVAFIFLTSPYIVMSANLTGYFDNIILLLTLLACWLVQIQRPALGGFVLASGVFVHETIVAVGIPSVLFYALVIYIKQLEEGQTNWDSAQFIHQNWQLIALPTVAFLGLAFHQTALLNTQGFVETYRQHLLAHPFIINNGSELVPTLLATSYFQFLNAQRFLLADRLLNRGYLFRMMPAVFLLLLYVWNSLQGIRRRKLILYALGIITLLPLSLHAIAFDTNRIWAYPLIVLMIGIFTISEIYPTAKLSNAWHFSAIAFLVVLSQLQMQTPLMGQLVERFSLPQRLILYTPALVGLLWVTMWQHD